MPNWCFNSLEISGPVMDLKKLKDLVEGKKTALDFNKIIPYPEDLAKADAANAKDEKIPDGYNHGGYTWCSQNWGTKWNVDAEVQGQPEDEYLDYIFDSAWSPPAPIVKKLGEMFPTLNFSLRYSEPGMCFEGELEIIKGNIIRDECWDMPTYKCVKCGQEQQMGEDECGLCECGSEEFERVDKK